MANIISRFEAEICDSDHKNDVFPATTACLNQVLPLLMLIIVWYSDLCDSKWIGEIVIRVMFKFSVTLSAEKWLLESKTVSHESVRIGLIADAYLWKI